MQTPYPSTIPERSIQAVEKDRAITLARGILRGGIISVTGSDARVLARQLLRALAMPEC